MTLAGLKWANNALRRWKNFVYLRKRIVKVNKIVRRVQKMHAFNHWISAITAHGIGQRFIDAKSAAVSNGKVLISITKKFIRSTSTVFSQANLQKVRLGLTCTMKRERFLFSPHPQHPSNIPSTKLTFSSSSSLFPDCSSYSVDYCCLQVGFAEKQDQILGAEQEESNES
jgi:hypothetical protein